MVGIMSSKEAQKIANSKNLDLVKIAPKANPPVCKVMDYRECMLSRLKGRRKLEKSKLLVYKEVRLSASIEDHDFEFKVKSN